MENDRVMTMFVFLDFATLTLMSKSLIVIEKFKRFLCYHFFFISTQSVKNWPRHRAINVGLCDDPVTLTLKSRSYSYTGLWGCLGCIRGLILVKIHWKVPPNRDIHLVELYKEKTSLWPRDIDLEVKVTIKLTYLDWTKVHNMT